MSKTSERGAVAVEFALLAPVLVMLLLGITEFGRAYNAQVTLSSAAREGVRVMAIGNSPTAARTAAKNAATGAASPALADTNITISPATCTAGSPSDPQDHLLALHNDRHRGPVHHGRQRSHAVRRLGRHTRRTASAAPSASSSRSSW